MNEEKVELVTKISTISTPDELTDSEYSNFLLRQSLEIFKQVANFQVYLPSEDKHMDIKDFAKKIEKHLYE